MNYLAHIFLSGNNRQVQVGNFVGNFVKGRSHEYFPKDIQRGILIQLLSLYSFELSSFAGAG